MNTYFDTFDTPVGPFSACVDEEGRVVATTFGPEGDLHGRGSGVGNTRSERRLAKVRGQVLEYFKGRRTRFELELAPAGTPFQQAVWKELLRIPHGTTCSYGELAKRLGKPGASRAVGSANGRNPICLIIPCHRVIASDGGLGGFAFGVELKSRLLKMELGVAAR